MGLHIETCQGGDDQICSFMWADSCWTQSQSKMHLEQMMKDLIEEAERRDLLWWTSTYADEKMERTGLHKLPFEKKFKILGYTFNQVGRMQDSLDERMQSANKASWRDVKIYRSKDVSWRIKCRRVVVQVCSVLCLGSDNWSRRSAIMDRVKGWKTKATRRLFRVKRR